MNPRNPPGDPGPADPRSERPAAGGPSPDSAMPDAPAPGRPEPATLPARLSSALTRPFAGATARFARRIPGSGSSGGAGRMTKKEAAAYDETLRHAFRAAVPFEPARPMPRPAPAMIVPEASAFVAALDVGMLEVTTPEPRVAPTSALPAEAPVTPPRDPEAPAWDPATISTSDGRQANEPPAGDLQAREPQALDPQALAIAPRTARRPAAAPTADLLQVPGTVLSTTDDFFGGLVRRVERRP
jgi:hypothetical protein